MSFFSSDIRIVDTVNSSLFVHLVNRVEIWVIEKNKLKENIDYSWQVCLEFTFNECLIISSPWIKEVLLDTRQREGVRMYLLSSYNLNFNTANWDLVAQKSFPRKYDLDFTTLVLNPY